MTGDGGDPTTTAPPEPVAQGPATVPGKDRSPGLALGLAFLTIIVVIGVVVSIVIATRDEDGPLVPAGDQGPGTAAVVEGDQFEQDPYFDELGHVVYIPRNERGVALPQSSPSVNRSATTPPAGIILQRVHGDMILPFSTSDGPTSFTDSGIATGFAHTLQGAGLAATHYASYLSTGNTAIRQLQDAGLLEDTEGLIAKQMELNASGAPGAVELSKVRLLPLIKIDYHEDLARVHFGLSGTTRDGRPRNVESWLDVVWRTGIGWVFKVGDASTVETRVVPDFSGAGWTTWW